jgi:hypothetical protein
MNTEVPITKHPKLPDGVPLVASFNDDRNRLSYYYPLINSIDGVRVPITKFIPINGNFDSHPQIEYREITKFMQDIQVTEAFVRGDYSSGKFDGKTGSHIESQDPYDIETTVLEMIRQISRAKRHIGGRIAVREWIPHDREVRYFFDSGEILYRDSTDGDGKYPDKMAEKVANVLCTLSWSCDFIRHEKTGKWYCIDMGLNGLYYNGSEWISHSDHLDKSQSPSQFSNDMPNPNLLMR